MKKRIYSLLTVICIVLNLMVYFPLPTFAATYGDLTYEIENDQVIIIDCDEDAIKVDIPAIIEGYPVTTIGEETFEYCDDLTNITISNSITTIGEYAFGDCDGLTSITIPDSVTTIGEYAFWRCDSLTNIIIPDSVTIIDEATFRECENLNTIIIPNSVTLIGESAFNNCKSLTNIIIPNSVTSIGESAFLGCDSLTNITIPDGVTTIEKSTFEYCDSLTNLTIPDSVTIIGNSAFADCESLTSITIPDSVTTIGESAFRFCESLINITIPHSVTAIGEGAFELCKNLTSIFVDENNSYFISENGVLFNKDKTTLIQYPGGNANDSYTVPYGVTTISKAAFCDCDNLTNITISDGVTTIENFAFDGCDSLTDITMPSSVKIIENYAFNDCDSLMNVYYAGNKQAWEKSNFGKSGNEAILETAKVIYNNNTTNNDYSKNWNSSFSDVPSNHWAYDAIMELADLGVINGMGDGTYNPNGTVTREQFIKLLVCANDDQSNFYPEVDFADVDDNSWSYEYICTGLSNGIFSLNDLENDTFEPQKGIDRDTVALWAVNTLGVWLDEESNFNDSYKINNSEAVATAVDEGIIKGYEDNTFRPNNTLTRAEAATIIKRTIDKIADNKTLRFSPNIVEKNDDVEDIYSDNNTNTLVDFDTDKGYYKFKNIDEDIEALTKGDIFTIPPSYEIPAGVAIKVKTMNVTGTTAEIWSDSIEADEVFSEIDISTMINGDLGYVAENSVPKGIEVTNAKGQTIAMAKEALKANNNYFYASTGGFQQTLKGTEELDLLKFKLEYEKDSHTKISGEITVLNPQFVVDFKYNAWDGLQYAELKAVLSCDAEVKYEKKLESREEDLTRIPLAKLVMPIGATGLYLEGDLYCDVGIDGKVEIKFETSQSFETGIKYEHGKLKNIKEQKNESAISATAEGAIKFGPNTELTLSAYGVINLKFGFEAGLKLDMELAKEISQENGVYKIHKCDLCIDGDLSGYFEVGGDITVGKGIFKVTVIEAKNEWEYIIADFYISRQLDEDKGIFGWGKCENFTEDNAEQDDDNSDFHAPFGNDINGLGNMHVGSFAISDGEYIYFSANKKIYRTDLDGNNQVSFAEVGTYVDSMCIYDGYIFAISMGWFSSDTIYRISLATGESESFIRVSTSGDLQIVNDNFLFSDDDKIYKLSLDAESGSERVYLSNGFSPTYYDGSIFFNNDDKLYKMDFKGEHKEVVLPYDIWGISIYNDKIYFKDYSRIYSANIDGSNIKMLYEEDEEIRSLHVHNNSIYFVRFPNSFGEDNELKRMSLNGENVTVASSGCWSDVCIVGDWFYSRSGNDYNTVSRGKDMMNFEKVKK